MTFEKVIQWAITDGEGGFIHRGGMNVELYPLRKRAREYHKEIKQMFPRSKVVRVWVAVEEIREFFK